MYAPFQFAKLATDHVITETVTITSPTIWVAANKPQPTVSQSLELAESHASILAAMGIPTDSEKKYGTPGKCVKPIEAIKISDRLTARKPRNARKADKNSNEVTVANNGLARNSAKKKKKKATAPISSGRICKKSRSAGKKPRQRKKPGKVKADKQYLARQEWLADWTRSESVRKAKETVDELAGLIDGFVITGAKKVRMEKAVVKGDDGMEVDLDVLQGKLAIF
ncbi:hypothetical protein L873DRAFT_1847260 [Choiromyces venosus 120613-1]|uniref:Uncharacterized protein n=1 Tax=Choiromyces venosus 120613-1 TaxID=1336337 RepID=A0A3N4JA92_9PEZI|nr:hypothetical protein L873DRAFT_1847260 [Choiromyces venosus 120613-1]